MINKVPSWCKVWNKLRIQLAWYSYALNLAGLEGRCSTILNFCLLAVVSMSLWLNFSLLAVMSTSLGYCWISVQIVSLGRDQVSRPFRRLHLELRDLSLIRDHNQLIFAWSSIFLHNLHFPPFLTCPGLNVLIIRVLQVRGCILRGKCD